MLKVVGAGLVIISGTVLGFIRAGGLKKRRDNLFKFSDCLSLLENEISYKRSDIKTALFNVGKSAGFPFFCECSKKMKSKNVCDAFSDALSSCDLCFKPQDIHAAEEFFGNLGMLGEKEQTASIRHSKELLLSLANSAERDYFELGRLYKSLGALLSTLLVILLF